MLSLTISQLPKLCVKISILMHRRMWVRSFSTRLTSVTFAEDKVLVFTALHGMQTRSYDEISVRLSVCQTCAL